MLGQTLPAGAGCCIRRGHDRPPSCQPSPPAPVPPARPARLYAHRLPAPAAFSALAPRFAGTSHRSPGSAVTARAALDEEGAASTCAGPPVSPEYAAPMKPRSSFRDVAVGFLTTTIRREEIKPAATRAPETDNAATAGTASAVAIGVIVLAVALVVFGATQPDKVTAAVTAFSAWLNALGPARYPVFCCVYVLMEMATVPSLPLAMAAGSLFGPLLGTVLVSLSATVAATLAFLVARWGARDRITALVGNDPRFAAIDRALGRDGLKVITLLRLSPLLPLAAANYLYGLTSVGLGPYVLGSWAGMLPGCYMLVSAGHLGASVAQSGTGALGGAGGLARLALGIVAAVLAIALVSRAATDALADDSSGPNKK